MEEDIIKKLTGSMMIAIGNILIIVGEWLIERGEKRMKELRKESDIV